MLQSSYETVVLAARLVIVPLTETFVLREVSRYRCKLSSDIYNINGLIVFIVLEDIVHTTNQHHVRNCTHKCVSAMATCVLDIFYCLTHSEFL